MSKVLTRSFAGGVITPEMFGRLDIDKYQTGLAEAVNFAILPHGPAESRAGTEQVLEVKDSSAVTCLVPFVYSTTQSMVLEFGNQYVRFHTQGGTLLETVKNITTFSVANPGVIHSVAHGYLTGDWVQVLGCGGAGFTALNFRFFKVVRLGADDYSLTDLAGNAINTSTFSAYTGGGTTGRVYEIVSPYATADLFDLHFTQSNDVLTIAHTGYQQQELRRIAATNWTFTALSFAPTIAAPASCGAVATVAAGATTNYFYVCTAIASSTLEESYASPSSAAAFNLLTTAGNFNTVTPPAVAGAIRFNVYRLINGLYGYVGQTDGSALIDNNITPDTTRTPPTADVVMASASNYPGGVGYYQGRRWFAGTLVEPQRAFATRSGTESNMSYSIPSRDADRLSFRIAARQANTIRHIVPIEDLVLLTSGGPWVISSTSGVVTGATLDPRSKGRIGASNVQPIISETSVLYATDRGNRIREFAFRGDINGGYNGVDISIMAPHYFDSYLTKQMAFTVSPHPTAWFVRSDGVLLGMTYVPEQKVAAWHSHSTVGGSFESICSVPEGSEDVLYAIVRRTVNGRTVRLIERKHTRLFSTLADAFFLDSAVLYNSTPATVITGLDHLIGKTVNALVDGAVVKDLVVGAVNNGIGVTLPAAGSKVLIGLPITAQLKTLPVSLETAEAAGQGDLKNVNKVYMRVSNSSGIYAGPTYATVRQLKQRTTEVYGAPPNLITDARSIVVSPDWNANGHICLQQTDPLPITLLSLTLEVAKGG